MLSQAAVKTAANELLAEATGLKIYGREVTEGFDTPSVFVEIISKPFSHKTINFAKSGFALKITFFQTAPDEFEQLQMIDTVKEAFGMVFTVQNRKLTVNEITYDYVGQKEDILQISVEFDFYENTTPKQQGEIARELDFRLIKGREKENGNESTGN